MCTASRHSARSLCPLAQPTKNTTPPQSARDVQRLIGRLVALNRFISKSAERSLPFLKTLHGAKDFVVDWTGPITQPDPSAEKVWTIHYDGAWCHAGAGAAAVITSPAGVKHRYAARLSFALESDKCTNNIAEYKAVILGLRKLRALGVTTCIVRTDSKVVAGQVEKDYAAKDPALMQYLATIRSLERQFKGFTLQHVDRAKNE
jgi:ribonuclease HI